MKFSLRYALIATALVAFALTILLAWGLYAFLTIVVFLWPAIISFSLAPSTMDVGRKLRTIFASSVLTLIMTLPMITWVVNSPFSLLIVVFFVLAICAAWGPQLLMIIQLYDASKPQTP